MYEKQLKEMPLLHGVLKIYLPPMRIVLIQQNDTEYAGYIKSMLMDYAAWLSYPILPLAHVKQAEHALYIQQISEAGRLKKMLLQRALKKQIAEVQPQLVVYLDTILQVHEQLPAVAFISVEHIKPHLAQPAISVYTSHANDFVDERIRIFPVAIPATYKPLEWQDRLLAKSGFTGNNEYFISLIQAEPLEAVIDLLKAFSHFKKWQASSMQLILICNTAQDLSALKNKISTYKYKDDIVILEDIADTALAGLLASAYAYIHFFSAADGAMPLVAALQCGTPVISSKQAEPSSYVAAYQEGLLIAENETPEATGVLMQRIYKDENLRTHLSTKATAYATQHDYEVLKKQLWRHLLEAAGVS